LKEQKGSLTFITSLLPLLQVSIVPYREDSSRFTVSTIVKENRGRYAGSLAFWLLHRKPNQISSHGKHEGKVPS
jgi:hypothetical protein